MFHRSTLLLTLSILPALAVAADELRPVTHEDVWTMKRLGTPVVSQDGRRAVVSVTEPSYEDDDTISDLWLVSLRGETDARRLTHSAAAEGDVDWSPDGTRIAFSAARDEEEPAQIYVLRMDGPGEAEQITDLSTGAGKPKWSPDGRRIAFESRIYPGGSDDEANAAEKAAREERDYNVSVYESFPVRQWDRWRDDLKTQLFVQDARAGAEARNLIYGSKLAAAPGFRGVEALGGDSLEAAWTPDGEALVISATDHRDVAAHADVAYHLYRVPVSGGEPQALTTSDEWSCDSAQFSPRGDALYCNFLPIGDNLYNLSGIARFEWDEDVIGSGPEDVTAAFDRAVTGFDLSADGRQIFLTALDAGRSRIFRVAASGGTVMPLDADSDGVYAGVTAADGALVARWESSALPAEIVRVDTRSGRHETLTGFNAERAAELDRPAFREFWFENERGLRVHSFLALPPGFDEARKYPLVLMIHGGPFSSSLDADHVRWSPHLLAAPGYVVLLTDYTGSVGYGAEFSRAIQGTPLRAPGNDILQAVDEALARYEFIDGERMAATGASYGGHLVNWLQGTTDRFDALVGHAGLVDLKGQYATSDTVYGRERMIGGPAWEDIPAWSEENPASYVSNFSTPILLTIGEKDYRVPVNQTLAAWTYVQRMQVPGRLLVFHDAGHWIMKGAEARYYWREVHAWLDKYLGESDAVAVRRR